MISMFLELAPIGFEQGLILAIVTTGIMIPFKLLNFPDLTAEGAYPLGGAICAALLINGINPIFATILASVCGGLIGIGTAFIHLRFKVNTLLAGIILSTMIYSINLKLMGKPNLALFDHIMLFSNIGQSCITKIGILLLLNVSIITILYKFLLTEKGLRLRAVGLNPEFATRQSVQISLYVFLGLFAGNFLASFAGSIMVQIQSYADINMGIGIVINALAALLIGESIIGSSSLIRQISAPLLGAVIYQQIQGVAIALGLLPSDLKLVTGSIVLLVISYKHIIISIKNAIIRYAK